MARLDSIKKRKKESSSSKDSEDTGSFEEYSKGRRSSGGRDSRGRSSSRGTSSRRSSGRESRTGGSSRGNFRRESNRRGDRPNFEMTKVTCSDCGSKCEVPFKPTSSKPVYCSDCFEKKGGKRSSNGRSDRNSSRDFDVINKKLDKIMKALDIE